VRVRVYVYTLFNIGPISQLQGRIEAWASMQSSAKLSLLAAHYILIDAFCAD